MWKFHRKYNSFLNFSFVSIQFRFSFICMYATLGKDICFLTNNSAQNTKHKNAASRNFCRKRSWLCLLFVRLTRKIRIENPDGPNRKSYQHPFIKSSPLADRFDEGTIECTPLLYHCISRRLILISSQLNKRVSTYLSCTYLSQV